MAKSKEVNSERAEETSPFMTGQARAAQACHQSAHMSSRALCSGLYRSDLGKPVPWCLNLAMPMVIIDPIHHQGRLCTVCPLCKGLQLKKGLPFSASSALHDE
eukprot:1137533-Pelagomonas_calceolata.AAC.2